MTASLRAIRATLMVLLGLSLGVLALGCIYASAMSWYMLIQLFR